MFVRMHDIEALHRELGTNLKPAIEQTPWNARLMEVTDPFGNRIRFSEDNSSA
jgi:uncharacterized glyoxalase superfamily protein PhnB